MSHRAKVPFRYRNGHQIVAQCQKMTVRSDISSNLIMLNIIFFIELLDATATDDEPLETTEPVTVWQKFKRYV